MAVLEMIAFDADDTLWHNETLYQAAQEKYKQLLSPYCTPDEVDQSLLVTEKRNLASLGYGIKAFTLSMIETALSLSERKITGDEVQAILELARKMIDTPVQLLEYVEQVVPRLAKTHRLMIVTKGDLLDQERKIGQSGLAPYVSHIEIVSEKHEEIYRSLLKTTRFRPIAF